MGTRRSIKYKGGCQLSLVFRCSTLRRPIWGGGGGEEGGGEGEGGRGGAVSGILMFTPQRAYWRDSGQRIDPPPAVQGFPTWPG